MVTVDHRTYTVVHGRMQDYRERYERVESNEGTFSAQDNKILKPTAFSPTTTSPA